MQIKIKKTVLISISIAVVFFMYCQQQMPSPPELTEINSKAEQIELSWDAPTENVLGGLIELKSFKIYYRNHIDTEWILLEEISAEDGDLPNFIINHSDLGNGTYDFAVNAIDLNDLESQIHSSLDPTAEPATGWYLVWIINKY